MGYTMHFINVKDNETNKDYGLGRRSNKDIETIGDFMLYSGGNIDGVLLFYSAVDAKNYAEENDKLITEFLVKECHITNYEFTVWVTYLEDYDED